MRLLVTILVAACWLIGSTSAVRAAKCLAYKEAVERLNRKYGEVRHVQGIISPSLLMEFYISPQGNWTVLSVNKWGTACIISHGGDLMPTPPRKDHHPGT